MSNLILGIHPDKPSYFRAFPQTVNLFHVITKLTIVKPKDNPWALPPNWNYIYTQSYGHKPVYVTSGMWKLFK